MIWVVFYWWCLGYSSTYMGQTPYFGIYLCLIYCYNRNIEITAELQVWILCFKCIIQNHQFSWTSHKPRFLYPFFLKYKVSSTAWNSIPNSLYLRHFWKRLRVVARRQSDQLSLSAPKWKQADMLIHLHLLSNQMKHYKEPAQWRQVPLSGGAVAGVGVTL